jgi:predicted Zn-dependent peptidase
MNDEALDRAINALQQAVRNRVADTKEIELRLNLLKEERQRRQTEGRWAR